MSDTADFLPTLGGPDPDCFDRNGRMIRCCKGGDGGAAKAAERARRQAQLQHEDNMRQLRKQSRVAANAKSPEFTPAAPPAAASVDTLEAGMDQRRRMAKRFGFNATKSGEMLGATSSLGGA
jgi:hypothetical protein